MFVSENPGAAGVCRSGPPRCFHCGLDCVPADKASQARVGEALRDFCCPGCEAVCLAIHDAGLEDFYDYLQPGTLAEEKPDLQAILERLRLYEREEIQKTLVFEQDHRAEVSLYLENIRCAACIWLNEKHLRKIPGIFAVYADFTTHRMRVEWDAEKLSLHDILVAIASIGYIAHPYDASQNQHIEKQRQQRSAQKLVFAGIFGMMLMQFSLATYLFSPLDSIPSWENYGRWSGLVIAFLILAYPGREFFSGAWRDAVQGRISMDLPIAIGLATAWFGSLHATITKVGEVYLDSIAMFVFLILLSRFWETRSKLGAVAELDRLSIAPSYPAHRHLSNGDYEEVAVSELQAGDRIRVYAGEQVPVDGRLLNDYALCSEALLSGESRPVEKKRHDPVLAGSMNGEINLDIEIDAVGTQSYLGRLSRLAQRGLEQKPKMVVLANKVAVRFVPAILLLALMTASGWYLAGSSLWLQHTVAVLIVSCPCALALAIPVAMTVSAANLLRLGIVPLRLSALESLEKLSAVVFDKTGTLTEGHYRLHSMMRNPSASIHEKVLLQLARQAASESRHPVALSLAHCLDKETSLVLNNVTQQAGQGIAFTAQGESWRLGNRAFVSDLAQTNDALTWLPEQEHDTASELVLGNETGIQMVFYLQDHCRPEAADTVLAIQKHFGLPVHLLSGDRRQSVASLAEEIGLKHFKAHQSPEQKLAYLQQLQQNGAVLMVGDGINDAPTLAAADASISLRSGTDMARTCSDFLLMRDRLDDVLLLLAHSRKTLRVVRQNLAWAIGYNLIAIPLAISGMIPPWGAALGMSLSSLIVVINAKRLGLT